MKKKLLAVLMTGVMAASFAGTATVVSCRWLVSSTQKITKDSQ